jgi:PAS domain S-box-containing protein
MKYNKKNLSAMNEESADGTRRWPTRVLSFILGAFILCLFSTIQKKAIGAPLVMTGYVVPFLVGGVTGLMIALWNINLRGSWKALQKANNELEAKVRERTDDIEKAIAKLEENEARWKFALEGSGDGVWDWNAVTNQVFFSKQWKTMLGYDENEIGDTLDEWDLRVHPDDKSTVMADIHAHLRGETTVYQNEHRVLCKDGSYKWILDRGKIIERTEDGKPLRIIGTHADISERKKAEAERESLIAGLEDAMANVKQLSGLLPICAHCKKIRDDKGYWNQIEHYLHQHSEAVFSHGICQECAKKYYPDLDIYDD